MRTTRNCRESEKPAGRTIQREDTHDAPPSRTSPIKSLSSIPRVVYLTTAQEGRSFLG
jgi:hypothetical protein